jgi:hypothetical protein
MVEDVKKQAHTGYGGGSSALDKKTLEGAIRKLLSCAEDVKTKQPDGSHVVRTVHETDPPADFFERRGMKRPGPLPVLLVDAEVKPGTNVLEHEHEEIDAHDDMDVRAYHHARWAVLEARRLQAKSLTVRSVEDRDGLCAIRVAFVR